MYRNPDIFDFKNYFVRDFPYGDNISENVLDSDIERAQLEASTSINKCLFSSQDRYSIAFNYLSAHYLVSNIKNSSQGLSSQYEGIISSKSVSSVSASYSMPDSIAQDPALSMYLKTNYGAKYIEIIYPLLLGSMFVTQGRTTP